MIDDPPETQSDPGVTGAEAETEAEACPPETLADDPHATRYPEDDEEFATRVDEPSDEFATRVDEGSTAWPGLGGPSSNFGVWPMSSLRYQIIRPHARGALGEVFLASDLELKREVALKEIQEKFADDPCSRSRFVVEAEVTGGLEHPGIVPVYGLGYHPDGRPYYAMRFVRGGTLKEAIDRHHKPEGSRPDPGEQALAFRKLLARFLGVCNAIAYAHSRGILHRDLKPGNVMLGPYGETLVVDWGLAKSLSEPGEAESVSDLQDPPGPLARSSEESPSASATLMGSVVGTPTFMSPEQAEGDLDRLGPPSDIYSLGATLYYLLTGKVPFPGPDVDDILKRVRAGEFPPPGKVSRRVPKALEAIALKAMAHRPEDRYPGAKALAADVEHWLAGVSVSAYRDWYAVRAWRWCRQRPILATAGLACLFFDLCILVILPLVYIQGVLHNGSFPRLNTAVGVLVLSPFVGQLGALIGSGLGAGVGLATRRTLLGLRRGASVGSRFGVASALLILLGWGAFEVAHPPSWTNLASWIAESEAGWPKLPEALTTSPRWIGRSGAPTEVAAFFEEVPRDQNAAPVYLDALIEFDVGMAPCFPPIEGNRRGAIALARKDRLRKFEEARRTDPSIPLEPLDALLDEYKRGFELLRKAQTFDRCVFQTGLGDQAGLPHAEAAREVERVTAFQVRRELERGEIDRAIDNLELLLRLARDIRSRGILDVQAESLALEGDAEAEVFLPILRHPGLTLEQVDRLLKLLQDHGSQGLDPSLEGFRAEYVRFGQILHAYLDPLTGDDRPEAPPSWNPFGTIPARLNPTTLDKATERKLATLLARTPPRDFVNAAHRAYNEFHQVIKGHRVRPLPERIDHANGLPPRSLAPHHHRVLTLAPDGGPFLKALARAEATRNAMKCLAALRRWEISGHPLDAALDLDAIVKAAGFTTIPADPFRTDGGPLRLRSDQGSPVIDSVGLEARDRTGEIDPRSGLGPTKNLSFRLKARGEAR